MCSTNLICTNQCIDSMKIARKFSLDRAGIRYETLTIEVEGDSAIEITQRIDQIFKDYVEKIKKGEIT